jgi:hypothetical protein
VTEHVAAIPPVDGVSPGVSRDLIAPVPAEQKVVPDSAEDEVVTPLAVHHVVARSGHYHVVAFTGTDEVVAGKAGDDLVAVGAHDDIGSVGAGDGTVDGGHRHAGGRLLPVACRDRFGPGGRRERQNGYQHSGEAEDAGKAPGHGGHEPPVGGANGTQYATSDADRRGAR